MSFIDENVFKHQNQHAHVTIHPYQCHTNLNSIAMFLPLFAILIILAYLLQRSILLALSRLLLVPPREGQEEIQRALTCPGLTLLKVGKRRSSYRRRLITASLLPSHYTNFKDNKVILLPEDLANGNDTFVDAMKARDPMDPTRRVLYGFFHPYANNGGGGEKVLWQAVETTLLQSDRNIAIIYTSNIEAQPLDILTKAEQKFNIKNLESSRIVFIYLRRFSALIDAAYWKHFTLLGQLLGSVLLGFEAIFELSPDIWIDTIGLPGSYWLVSLILKIPIVAYVHYPIIQPDMFNNLKFGSFSSLKSYRGGFNDTKHAVKLIYWSFMSLLYTYLGSCVDLTLANGTWTLKHMKNIWYMNDADTIRILHPPCSTEMLACTEISGERENKLLYIAQFRPEKRHSLIVAEFSKFLNRAREANLPVSKCPKVVFLGSCKTKDDSFTLNSVRKQVEEQNLTEYVEFIVDCPFSKVKSALKTCTFGLNAMWNEHFGIGVVEYVSSGVVPIVHASAGPLLDILSVKGPSLSWENDAGFFFKSKSDPDYGGRTKDGLMEFEVANQPLFYSSLSEVLCKLFIEDTAKISKEKLNSKREVGLDFVIEKFSNNTFCTQWAERMDQAAKLEKLFRKSKRDRACAVF